MFFWIKQDSKTKTTNILHTCQIIFFQKIESTFFTPLRRIDQSFCFKSPQTRYFRPVFGMKNHLLAFLLAVLATHLAVGQGTRLRLTVGAAVREVGPNERLQVTYELSGSDVGTLRLGAVAPFRKAGAVGETTGMQIVNGQVTARHAWTYEFIAPAQVGTYPLPSATAQVPGQPELRTEPLSIRVTRSTPPTAPSFGKVKIPAGANPNIFVVAELSRPRARAGEQVICQVSIYTRLAVEGFDVLAFPKISHARAEELKRFDTRTQLVKIKNQPYNRRVVYAAALFPDGEAPLEVGPTSVRASVEEPGTYFARPMLLKSPALALPVEPLPTPLPPDAIGTVGRYGWECTLDHDTVRRDEACTVTFRYRGNGDAQRMALPRLILPAGLEGFDPKISEEDSHENGQEYLHSGVATYTVQARQAGDYRFQPTFSWFDPDSNRYVGWQADTLLLHVVARPDSVSPNPALPPVTPDTHPSLTDAWPSSRLLGWLSIGLAALLSAAYVVWCFFRKKKEKTPKTAAVSPSQRAKTPDVALGKSPAASVRPASTNTAAYDLPDTRQALRDDVGDARFFDILYREYRLTLAHRLGISPAEWSQDRLRQRLTERAAPPDLVQSALEVLTTCEQVLYGGQQLPHLRVEVLTQATRVLNWVNSRS
jgi:hypothetical protein